MYSRVLSSKQRDAVRVVLIASMLSSGDSYMSHSFKKLPIVGNCSGSDKLSKRFASRNLRREAKEADSATQHLQADQR